jgi:hypothetical protein
MGVGGRGGVFVSYRRADSGDAAGRLADRLAGKLGDQRVFMDVEIELGADWVEEITAAVAACDVMVAVIGPGWLSAADSAGRRRLDDPDDWVRLEVRTALQRGVRLIPVLVGGAAMPLRVELPPDIADLTRRQSLHVRHESFRKDAEHLLAAVERLLSAPGTSGRHAAAVGSTSGRPASAVGNTSGRPAAAAGNTSGRPGQGAAAGTAARDSVVRANHQAKAERIAWSIPDQDRRWAALLGVAVAVAAADPADAERIAASINDGDAGEMALLGVAVAIAAADPVRAERIANSMSDDGGRMLAFLGVTVVVATAYPAGVERLTASITGEADRLVALVTAAVA